MKGECAIWRRGSQKAERQDGKHMGGHGGGASQQVGISKLPTYA